MADAVNILRRANSADKAPLFEPYSKVVIHAGLSSDGQNEVIYTAGNDSGRTLEVNNEWGTQGMANTILSKIAGYQYQPFQARQALIDPSVELGDGITVNGIYSGIFVQATTFNSLMASDVSAPVDEEIEHEYGFESQTNRAFTRMVAQTRSGITQNANEISSEVERLEKYIDDENNEQTKDLRSEISQTAHSIRATVAASQKQYDETEYNISQYGYTAPNTTEYPPLTYNGQYYLNQSNGYLYRSNGASWSYVTTLELISTKQQAELAIHSGQISAKVSKTGGTNSSFGWNMDDSSHTWYANNQEIMKLQRSGLTVTGKIQASSGFIGSSETNGFTISASAIYNGMTSLSDTTHNGIYLGKDGIALGKGNFKVTSDGRLTAKYGYIGNGSSGFEIGSNYIRNGMTSLSDTTHDGIYVGTDGIALGKGKFKVSSNGSVVAKNLELSGGSININDKFKVSSTGALTAEFSSGSISIGNNFSVSSTGEMTAKTGYIGNGSSGFKITASAIYNGMTSLTDANHDGVYISTSGIALGKGGKFRVTSSGAVSASDMTITGGSITIKDNNGNVVFEATKSGGAANSYYMGATCAGKVVANDTLGWISGGYNGQIEAYSVTGGADGNIAAYSVAYGNTGFTGTLDQVGVNKSNIEAINGYFTGTANFNYAIISVLQASAVTLGGHSLYYSDGYVRYNQ